MINRRDVIRIGAATPLVLGLPQLARATTSHPSDLWVRDSRFANTRDALAPARATRIVTIDGDVTTLWRDTLDALWRQRGTVLAGVTGGDALFVLEHLAWGRGRRVTERIELAPAGEASRTALFYWRIVPSHASTRAQA